MEFEGFNTHQKDRLKRLIKKVGGKLKQIPGKKFKYFVGNNNNRVAWTPGQQIIYLKRMNKKGKRYILNAGGQSPSRSGKRTIDEGSSSRKRRRNNYRHREDVYDSFFRESKTRNTFRTFWDDGIVLDVDTHDIVSNPDPIFSGSKRSGKKWSGQNRSGKKGSKGRSGKGSGSEPTPRPRTINGFTIRDSDSDGTCMFNAVMHYYINVLRPRLYQFTDLNNSLPESDCRTLTGLVYESNIARSNTILEYVHVSTLDLDTLNLDMDFGEPYRRGGTARTAGRILRVLLSEFLHNDDFHHFRSASRTRIWEQLTGIFTVSQQTDNPYSWTSFREHLYRPNTGPEWDRKTDDSSNRWYRSFTDEIDLIVLSIMLSKLCICVHQYSGTSTIRRTYRNGKRDAEITESCTSENTINIYYNAYDHYEWLEPIN